jgi:hypothetical protein
MQMEDKRTYLQEIYSLAEKHLAQMAEDELARFCDGLWRYYQANDPDDPRYIRNFRAGFRRWLPNPARLLSI